MCDGCLKIDQGKPEHCRKCRIKECVQNKKLIYCYECPDFPCKLIKNIEKSYNSRYSTSLIQNSLMVKEKGMVVFLNEQKNKFTCFQCGGVISLHDFECSECHLKFK